MASSATRRTLFTVLSRSLSSSSPSSSSFFLPSSISSRLRFSFPLLNRLDQIIPNSFNLPIRFKSSGSGYSPLNDPSPNWSNRPPKETILLDGCDYEHWLIVMEFPTDPKPSEEEMVNSYVKILAAVVGSEEEAKKKIYSVSTTTYTGFGALISEELSYKVKELPGVLWVLPDSYLDVPNKDYGGDLFIDGKVIPRPQYRYNDRQQSGRNRPRPRYDRRRETMQVERSQPIQRHNWGQNQGDPLQPPPSIDGQNTSRSGVGDFSTNPGEFNRSNH
ncbi:multiple organellar RNA editing factor 3, mitochondrial [Benincasa hispida]|uniref:multiple organellar RNA editing factor 3, mitochondrial n=1 Tax=Benincasa hispida TaxID=102211 RepID=UPI001901E16D|nr:multiple organellar RNA editing factor 3, mitochondrial [Benincasa hispida]